MLTESFYFHYHYKQNYNECLNCLNLVNSKFTTVKKLEDFGWSVKTYSRIDKTLEECCGWGSCKCPDRFRYSIVYTIVLKLEVEV